MIELRLKFDASPDLVWVELADLASHHEWMKDAETIGFDTDQTTGIGTRMTVPTRVGPFTTNDQMIVTEWVEGRTIAVEHRGVVSGRGRFDIASSGDGTDVTWTEELRFPWYLGGSVGAWFAAPVLRRIWKGNLRRLAERVSSR